MLKLLVLSMRRAWRSPPAAPAVLITRGAPSAILLADGIDPQRAHGSLRVTLLDGF